MSVTPSSALYQRFPKTLPVRISGLGKYLPPRVMTNDELEPKIGKPAGWIEKRTGILSRHVADGETTPAMAAKAARIALERAERRIEDMDAIIYGGAAPYQAIPSTSVFVQAEFGKKARGIPCTDANATCFSAILAMNNAAMMIATGQAERVLVCTAEQPHRGFMNYDHAESAALFGDGAAACVIERDDGQERGFVRFAMRTFSEGRDLARIVAGGTRHLPSDEDYEVGFQYFDMDGKGIFKTMLKLGKEIYNGFLEDNLAFDEYDTIIPHQVNAHGISMYAKKFGFDKEKVFSNVAHVGNMVAASLPVALCDAVDSGRIRRGDNVALIGTAAGLTFGGLSFVF